MNVNPDSLQTSQDREPMQKPCFGLPLFRILSRALLLPVFLTAAPIFAQVENKTHSVRFSLIGLSPLESDGENVVGGEEHTLYGIHFLSDGEEKRIDRIPIHNKTREYQYRGEGPLVFYRNTANSEGSISRQVLARVEIAPEWENILIVIMPQRAGAPDGFATFVVNDDADSFPVNSMRLVNFSGSDLAWLMDKHRERVPVHGSATVTVNVDRPRMVPMRLAALDADNNEWKQTYATSLPFRGNQRFLCVVLPAGPNSSRFHATPIMINDAPRREGDERVDAERIEQDRVR